LTVPLPVPLPPELIAIHVALLVAVQPHPVPAVTPTLAAPPADVALGFVGDTPNAQAAACVTVTVCPATVIVPVRLDVTVFAATE
jgi:hypothetical protein